MPKQLTQTQQTDLKLWKQSNSLELPTSLKNLLIEDCLEELKKDEGDFNRFGRFNCSLHTTKGKDTVSVIFSEPFKRGSKLFQFNGLPHHHKILVTQTLLSRTPPTPEHPNGQAIMPFLDVENIDIERWLNSAHEKKEEYARREPQTLQEKLSLGFWESTSMQGKTFEQALEIITKIYISNIYDTL